MSRLVRKQFEQNVLTALDKTLEQVENKCYTPRMNVLLGKKAGYICHSYSATNMAYQGSILCK